MRVQGETEIELFVDGGLTQIQLNQRPWKPPLGYPTGMNQLAPETLTCLLSSTSPAASTQECHPHTGCR